MTTGKKEILINEEALEKVNKSTMELKEKMNTVMEDISNNNKKFISQSKGNFATAFENMSNSFEKEMREQINKLNEINQYAETTLQSNIELDKKLASMMIE